MPVRIPEKNRKFSIDGNGVYGNIAGGVNLDFRSKPGRVRIGGRGVLRQSISGISPKIPRIARFIFGSSDTWFIAATASGASSKLYVNSSPNSTSVWSADATSGSPTGSFTNQSDLLAFTRNATLYAANNTTTVNYLQALAVSWSTLAAGINVKLLCQFQNRMYGASSSQIVSWDTGNTVAAIGSQYTTTILQSFTGESIQGMVSTQDAIFILVTSSSNSAKVYVWNGIDNASATASTGISQIIPLSANASSGKGLVVKDNIPYVMCSDGSLYKYTGSTFSLVASLPRPNLGNVNYTVSGSMAMNDEIYFAVSSSGTNPTYFLPGVWAYNESVGFYHRSAPSASSGAASSVTDFYVSDTLGDLGFVYAGLQNTASGFLVYGCSTGLIAQLDNGPVTSHTGCIYTQEIDASEIDSTWAYLYVKHSPLYVSGSKLYVKYRNITKPSYSYSFTFGVAADNRTITVSDPLSLFSSTWSVGDEFTGLTGEGGGMTAHIVSISGSGTSYTVTLDESFPGCSNGASGTCMFMNFKKLSHSEGTAISGSPDSTRQYHQFALPINSNNTRIQVKIVVVLDSDSTAEINQEHLFELDEIVLTETSEIKAV